jgi:hypothetical protein
MNRMGWPFAEAVFGAATGRDILGTPGLALEVKATADNPLPAALRQAVNHAGTSGDLPLVIWRPNGRGESDVGEWVMALRVEDGLRLLAAAGYGDGSIDEPQSIEENAS